jgi:PhnB protein
MPETIPDGYSAVTPWIISRDTRQLIEFLKSAFGAEEVGRMEDPEGAIVHAEMRINGGMVMMFDRRAETIATPAFIRVFVDDAQAAFDNAIENGAQEITRPTMLAFGDRVGRVRDPLGNIWWLQERVEDVSPAEQQRRWSDPEWGERMGYVQRTLADALKR